MAAATSANRKYKINKIRLVTMCGIFALFDYKRAASESEFRIFVKSISDRLVHRGPDWSGVVTFGKENALAHERLSIVGTSSGSQPLTSGHSPCCLTVNGEIYNHMELRTALSEKHEFQTQSDCEVILHLFEDAIEKNTMQAFVDACKQLDGIFAFVLFDGSDYYAARDPIGVCPLYQGWGKDGSVWFASEMKCLVSECERIVPFAPGHFCSSRSDCFSGQQAIPYYQPVWYQAGYIPSEKLCLEELRKSFIRAVKAQMMSEVPFGALLSGGLDSSLVASILNEEIKERNPAGQLMTFSIGLPGAPDLIAARKVAEWLGTKHYEFHFTIQEGIDMIPKMIWHLESFDVTTIRASIPMFFLSRHIKALGIKMVLSGEGSDEIFGGYLYFSRAPDADSLHQETVRRVQYLHLSDCLRANKSTMAWGVEARVPFLDLKFLDLVMTMDPKEKVSSKERIEKYVLRKAFDASTRSGRRYLPDEVLWRQKEQFSDGVGYSWIDSLKGHGEKMVSDERMKWASEIFPISTPTTKEGFYYRDLFEKMFPGSSAASTVDRWVPRADWGCPADPSGRAQAAHNQSIVRKDAEGCTERKSLEQLCKTGLASY